MAKPARASDSRSNPPEGLSNPQQAEDAVEEASEESFPASDSPAWNTGHEAAPASAAPAPTDESKQGCAVSFLNEERDEQDELCERTEAEKREEYVQPEKEKEAGGEG